MVEQVVTLVRGATVCVAGEDGEIDPATFQGIYHRDARIVSRLALTVNGQPPALLAAQRHGASTLEMVYALAVDRYGSPTALLLRTRTIDADVRECLEVRVFEGELGELELRLHLECDFADLTGRKEHRPPPVPARLAPAAGGWLAVCGRFGLDVVVQGATAVLVDGELAWTVEVKPGQHHATTVVLTPRLDAAPVRAVSPPDARTSSLTVHSRAEAWQSAVASALVDLDALRIYIPELDLSYIGAGAPWFMALFGRDTLLTALESMLAGTAAGFDVLDALARFQGRQHDPRAGEQPGRILHELRTGGAEVFGMASGVPYYGTVDASPLFVMLLDEVHRWGGDEARVRELLPAARAALDWCIAHGDIDGDGFVEYVPDPHGLANQGWKDSGDSMVHADGRLARGPIALAEVQAYVWAACAALARLEERVGDPGRVGPLRARAASLRAAFAEHFWLPEAGVVAMALDADKQPLVVASSNMGHCLWAGVVDDEVAAALAHRLTQPDLFAGWGVRTLASGESSYNPLSYHLGSIWPHDTALIAAGLMRYGFVEQATTLIDALLTTARHFGWRLPELLGGLDPTEVPYPVPYPVACSPQAWSAASPLLLLRAVLRLEADVPAGVVHLAPVLPADVELHVAGIDLGRGRLSLRARGHEVEILEQPEGLRVVLDPAPTPTRTPG